MVSIHVDDEDVITLVKGVYANKLNAASRAARYGLNAKKQRFIKAFRAAANVEGDPAEGDTVIAIYHFCLPRCDWDAPIKAVQDAVEDFIACKNDRVIRAALTFLTRPIGKTKKRPQRSPFIQVYLYDMGTELEDALDRAREIGEWSLTCWQSSY